MVKRGDFKLPFGTIYRQLSYLRNRLIPVSIGQGHQSVRYNCQYSTTYSNSGITYFLHVTKATVRALELPGAGYLDFVHPYYFELNMAFQRPHFPLFLVGFNRTCSPTFSCPQRRTETDCFYDNVRSLWNKKSRNPASNTKVNNLLATGLKFILATLCYLLDHIHRIFYQDIVHISKKIPIFSNIMQLFNCLVC